MEKASLDTETTRNEATGALKSSKPEPSDISPVPYNKHSFRLSATSVAGLSEKRTQVPKLLTSVTTTELLTFSIRAWMRETR